MRYSFAGMIKLLLSSAALSCCLTAAGEGPQERTNDSKTTTEWQTYVVRRNDWDTLKIYGGKETQEAYGRLMGESVRLAAAAIGQKPFAEVLDLCARRRREAACVLAHSAKEQFGVPVDSKLHFTPCTSGYADLRDFLLERQSVWIQDPTILYRSVDAIAGLESVLDEAKAKGLKVEIGEYRGKVAGQELALSRILIIHDPGKVMSEWLQDELLAKADRSSEFEVTVVHTEKKNIASILGHVERVYEQALEEKSSGQRLKLLGEVFWWICQAKPWLRGDPSIAEILVRGVMVARNNPNMPWKLGVVPWVEVMKEPDVEKFAAGFHHLFEAE